MVQLKCNEIVFAAREAGQKPHRIRLDLLSDVIPANLASKRFLTFASKITPTRIRFVRTLTGIARVKKQCG